MVQPYRVAKLVRGNSPQIKYNYITRPKISVLCSERRLTKSAGCPRAQ